MTSKDQGIKTLDLRLFGGWNLFKKKHVSQMVVKFMVIYPFLVESV